MIDKKPLVSVIVPAYNQGNFIPEAIDSALNQDFFQSIIEVIVVDDGSKDNTKEVVDGYNDKVFYINKGHNGKAFATKIGIEAANGEYILNLDADDMFLPDKIRKVVDVFEKDQEITHISHPVIYWDEERGTKKEEKIPAKIKGQKIYGKDLLHYFYKINRFIGCGSSFAARADVLKKIPINKREMNYAIDAYMVLFSANAGYSYFMDEPLSLYRVHGAAYSLKDAQKRAEIDMLANQAILSEIKGLDFDEDIKTFQTLKTKISQLKFREFSGEKTISDIKGFWPYVVNNRKIFGKDIFSIIKNYRILQRSTPTSILNIFRKLSGKT